MSRVPPPPFELSPEESEFYKEIGATVIRTKKFTNADRYALALLAQQIAFSVRIRRELSAGSLVTNTGRGGVKADPRVAQLKDAVDQCTRLLVQFGLTPASRHRAQEASTGLPDDPLANEFKV